MISQTKTEIGPVPHNLPVRDDLGSSTSTVLFTVLGVLALVAHVRRKKP